MEIIFVVLLQMNWDIVDDDIRSLSSSLAGSKTEASGFEIGSSASGTYLLAFSTPASLTLQLFFCDHYIYISVYLNILYSLQSRVS